MNRLVQMKKSLWILIFIGIAVLILIIGLSLKEKIQTKVFNNLINEKDTERIKEQGLGELCSNEDECITFCQNNKERCEAYCNNNENKLCQIISPKEGLKETALFEEEIKDDKKCKGTKTKFDYAPVNLDKTLVMLPLGLMAKNHVTPIDHHYFQNFDNEEYDIEIYSPGDGFITEIGHMPGAKNGEDYRVVIEHTCTISSVYIHLGIFSEKFKEYAPTNNRYASISIPVTAGEVIGYYKKNVDYNLVDNEIVLKGFVVPENYNAESWKIHVPNTYEYFNEPIRNKLIEKSLRTAEPISGKIDYDIDGKLVGNWFLEGTNGYAGSSTNKEGYWLGHLSFVYDAYDPNRIVISIGNYNNEEQKQFGAEENSPNPTDITIEDGLVKYELIEYDYITPNGNSWDRKSLIKDLKTKSYEVVQGVVLVQMIENRRIKFEAFPGKTASQVSKFTQNAKIYER